MGVLNENAIIGASGGEDAYTIDYSCRFNDNNTAYLARTPGSDGNRRTWTLSFWVKRGNLHATVVQSGYYMFCCGADDTRIMFTEDGSGDTFNVVHGGSTAMSLLTTPKYRDISSWYHFVVAMDTTQGTASNRCKIYVNGVQELNLATATYPAENADLNWNKASSEFGIGRSSQYTSRLFDGYLAEVHWIDGTALTPSSFGETGDYGEWKPIKYTGSHGTNGYYLDFKNAGVVYETGDRRSSITVTHSGLTVAGGTVNGMLDGVSDAYGISAWFAASVSSGAYLRFEFDSAKVITENKWYQNTTHSGATWQWQGSNDATNWTNIGSSFQMTCSTANQGEVNTQLNGNTTAYTYYQMLYVSGSNNANPYWQEIEFATGTPAVNGLGTDASGEGNHFTPTNIATSDQVTDTPTNNFSVMNNLNNQPFVTTFAEGNLEITTGGSQHEPSNMATFGMSSGKWYFEVYQKSGGSDALLGIRSQQPGTISPTAKDNPGKSVDGYALYANITAGNLVHNNAYVSYGNLIGYTNGDIISIAVDLDNNKCYWAKNGTWLNSGNPAGNSNGHSITAASSTSTGEYFPCFGDYDANSYVFLTNFGQDGTFAGNVTAGGNADGNGYGNFKYSVPSGFLSLCSANLPEPTVTPSEHFNIHTYTQSGSTNDGDDVTVTTKASNGMVWIKKRSGAFSHCLFDSIRGSTNLLRPDTDDATNASAAGGITFGTDSYTIGNDSTGSGFNEAVGATYVAWSWRSGGTPTADNSAGEGATPTAGSVKIDGANLGSALAGNLPATRLTANTTAGFSITKYAGTGTEVKTVAHGLSKAPELVIIKRIEDNAHGWQVGSIQSLGSMDFTDALYLHDTIAISDAANWWNDTAPSSTVVTLGGNSWNNNASKNFMMYCWHSVEGYSKIGGYVANYDADGTFFYTGFRPAFVMTKRMDSTGWWVLFDTARSTSNPCDHLLSANENNAENGPGSDTMHADILSNGFKLREQDSYSNASGGTFLYIAFAEQPFKYSNSR